LVGPSRRNAPTLQRYFYQVLRELGLMLTLPFSSGICSTLKQSSEGDPNNTVNN
jgi:hypothetical protein